MLSKLHLKSGYLFCMLSTCVCTKNYSVLKHSFVIVSISL